MPRTELQEARVRLYNAEKDLQFATRALTVAAEWTAEARAELIEARRVMDNAGGERVAA